MFFWCVFFFNRVSLTSFTNRRRIRDWSYLHNAPSIYSNEDQLDLLVSATFISEEETQRVILTWAAGSTFDLNLDVWKQCAGLCPCEWYIAAIRLPLVVYFHRGPWLSWLGQVPGFIMWCGKLDDPYELNRRAPPSSSFSRDEHKTYKKFLVGLIFYSLFLIYSISSRWGFPFQACFAVQAKVICLVCRMWLLHIVSFSCILGCP